MQDSGNKIILKKRYLESYCGDNFKISKILVSGKDGKIDVDKDTDDDNEEDEEDEED